MDAECAGNRRKLIFTKYLHQVSCLLNACVHLTAVYPVHDKCVYMRWNYYCTWDQFVRFRTCGGIITQGTPSHPCMCIYETNRTNPKPFTRAIILAQSTNQCRWRLSVYCLLRSPRVTAFFLEKVRSSTGVIILNCTAVLISSILTPCLGPFLTGGHLLFQIFQNYPPPQNVCE